MCVCVWLGKENEQRAAILLEMNLKIEKKNARMPIYDCKKEQEKRER